MKEEKRKRIKTSVYLYDIEDMSVLDDMNYKDALEYKVEAAKKLNNHLFIKHFKFRDTHRINAVNDAIKFNKMLLDEMDQNNTIEETEWK